MRADVERSNRSRETTLRLYDGTGIHEGESPADRYVGSNPTRVTFASMMELVDMMVLETIAAGRVGSTPT